MTTNTNNDKKGDVSTEIKFFDLDKVRFIMKDAIGLDVGYAYDDLVFSEDAVFIMQFDQDDSNIFYCYFNHECHEPNRIAMLAELNVSAQLNGVTIVYKGKFELQMSDKTDSFAIKFL